MSGTMTGGKKAAQTNKEKHGKDFYKRIGQIGGKNSSNGGFGSNKVGKDGLTGLERARLAGAKGGQISRRKPKNKNAKRVTTPSKKYTVSQDYIPTPNK